VAARHPARILLLAFVAAAGLRAAPARADEGSRWIAALPFGAGQFQNGDVALGIYFACGEAGFGVTSIATAAIATSLLSTDIHSQPRVDIAELNDRIHTVTAMNQVAFAGWAALTAAGIIEAQVNLGQRRVPMARQPVRSFAATAAPVPGGGLLGVRFAF